MSASSLGVEHNPSLTGPRHSLRAGDTILYHDPLFTACDKRGRRQTKITAIRKLRPDGGGGKGGVRVKRQAETGEMVGAALYMEVCFADGAAINEDHGV